MKKNKLNVLYFIEPSLEMGNEKFRLGSIRNHLNDEINNLKKYCNVDIIISKDLLNFARDEGLLENINTFIVSRDKITKSFGSHREQYSNYQDKKYTCKKEIKFYEKLLKEYKPDVVVLYECLAPYFKKIYPNAIIINETLGVLSRAPYPELSCFDINGIIGDATSCIFKDRINNIKFKPNDYKFIEEYKSFIQKDINKNKVDLNLFNKFERNILLPLQVSGYFTFDHCCEFKSQLDYVEQVLNDIDKDIGIIITMHGIQNDIFDSDRGKSLLEKHDNLLIFDEVNELRWSSQHILPYCDGVISVSSSVVGTAALWDLPIYVYGKSQYSIFSDESLDRFIVNVINRVKVNHINTLVFFLLYYNVTTFELKNSDYFYKFITNLMNKDIDCVNFYLSVNNDRSKLYSEYRNRLFDIENNKYSPQNIVGSIPTEYYFERSLSECDIVSFDIFDTLISRKVYNPNTVFDLMQPSVKNEFNKLGFDLNKFGGFRKLRERAANRCIRRAKNDGIEDISLKDIYNEIRALTNIPSDLELAIRKLEITTELNVTIRREYGYKIFNLAKKLDKKIIFVSDMYLSESDVKLLLKKNGYDSNGVDIFVSSEFGKTKKSGSLFDIVNDKYHDNKIIHIGDNYYSDYVMARNKGIQAIAIPSASDNFENSYCPRYEIDKNIINSNVGSNIYYGLVSRKFFDETVFKKSHFGGDPKVLGYFAGGPIMFGFVRWICEQVKLSKIDKVYFLARDGYLVKEIYDEFRKFDTSLPKSEYLLASRRCYNTASFSNEQDILSSISMSFSQSSIRYIFEKRYNILSIPLNKIISAGFSSSDDVIDLKRGSHKRKFLRLLSIMKDEILASSESERKNLIRYLKDKDFFKNEEKCVIDIGHNGTLQRDLSKITDTKFHGLYFMTFSGAESLLDYDLPVKGYLANFEDQKLSYHPYVKNIGMFEFLFLPPIPSFERFDSDADGNLREVYVSGNEQNRFDLIEIIHDQVKVFSQNVLKIVNGNYKEFNLSKNNCIKTYVDFISNPCVDDVNIFSGISFVDGFGGNSSRFIISEHSNEYEVNIKNSWWRKGAEVYFMGNEHVKEKLSLFEYTTPKSIKYSRVKRVLINKKKIKKFLFKPHIVILNRLNKYIFNRVLF